MLTYLQLMDPYRDGEKIRQRLVKKLGRMDQVDPGEIDRLIRSLAPYGSVAVGNTLGLEDMVLNSGREHGSFLALDHVWNELNLPGIVGDLAADRRFGLTSRPW